MRAQFFQIAKTGDSSFLVEEDRLVSFYGLLHYHPEIQLTLIVSGSGLRLIGDQVMPFSPGSLMFIGENQPHVFRNNPVEDGRFVEAISIYFNRNAFGANFFQLPEVRMISKFLDRTAKGIDVTGNTRTYLEEKIMRLGSLSGFRRFSQFLEILDVCAGSSELVPLSDFGVELVGRDHDADRLNKVFNHVFSHLHEDIHLQDIASMVHLTPGGFCRFFRKKTRKSFFGFLIEVRISKSMELLRETGSTVSECAFDSGFRNLSHFNREFLRITAMTPTVYRQQFTVRK